MIKEEDVLYVWELDIKIGHVLLESKQKNTINKSHLFNNFKEINNYKIFENYTLYDFHRDMLFSFKTYNYQF